MGLLLLDLLAYSTLAKDPHHRSGLYEEKLPISDNLNRINRTYITLINYGYIIVTKKSYTT